MNPSNSPIVKRLVLIGGGHSHLAVLKRFGMRPIPGLAITLISREIVTPYSGSMPGHISGFYSLRDMHIDLRPLARFANVRIIQADIENIDLDSKRILMTDRPDIEFDILSLNIGSKPADHDIPGAARHTTAIKPIDSFLNQWQNIHARVITTLQDSDDEFSMTIVGGGPASVEFALAAQYRVHTDLGLKLTQESRFRISVVTADSSVLTAHNSKVRSFVNKLLASRHIEVLPEHLVTEFQANSISCASKAPLRADFIVLATGASLPEWPAKTGLKTSEDGFISVSNSLQSQSHEFVFAAGDMATIEGEARPKSGVYAVRHGKPLAENLARYAVGKKLLSYKPQQHALALISLGGKTAIASRNNFSFQGRSAWELKNKIDNSFLRKYSDLPEMDESIALASGLVDEETEQELKTHAMRCAGCGAKVAGDVLNEVLQELPVNNKADIVQNSQNVEDAALIKLEDDRVLLQSVDQLKAFIDDPYLFAKIASNHCMSDIYAMGCMPHSALAVVGLPFAEKKISKSELRELMRGCSDALLENDCTLIGGHSAEASELQFGLCVNGFTPQSEILAKTGMKTSDVLILTKALGTGTLFAADMRHKARHEWVAGSIQQMLISNRSAAQRFVEYQASACTDITGFGLAGHLLEMMSDNVEVELSLGELPVLDGALELLQQKIYSSLHKDNGLAREHIYNSEAFLENPLFELLFDPQTAGGLLASVPESRAQSCLQALLESGCNDARIIGRVSNGRANAPALVLK